MDARTDGIPALIVEVASKTTWRVDVGLDPRARVGAKGYEYLALGVPEYLVFDPQGEFIAEQCRGWRLREGQREPWPPEAEGRYHSALGVSFQPEGQFLRIYAPDGTPLLLDHEVTDLEDRAVILEEKLAVEAARAAAAEEQAATEAARAVAAEERVRQLEERLRRLGQAGGDAPG
jgi:Uma2 family endonuclease